MWWAPSTSALRSFLWCFNWHVMCADSRQEEEPPGPCGSNARSLADDKRPGGGLDLVPGLHSECWSAHFLKAIALLRPFRPSPHRMGLESLSPGWISGQSVLTEELVNRTACSEVIRNSSPESSWPSLAYSQRFRFQLNPPHWEFLVVLPPVVNGCSWFKKALTVHRQ